MNKTILLIGLCMFIVIGCTNDNPNGFGGLFHSSQGKNIDEEVPDIYKGERGLILKWTKEQIENSFVGTIFPVVFEVNNIGVHDVENARLVLGVESDYNKIMKIESTHRESTGEGVNIVDFTIEGKKVSNPNGGKEVFVAEIEPLPLDPQSERHVSVLTATVCYQYQTDASFSVCIDPDIGGRKPGEKACDSETVEASGGQGAPVAITKVETRMVRQSTSNSDENNQRQTSDTATTPNFWIYVDNVGGGQIVKSDRYGEFCSKRSSISLSKFLSVVEVEAKLSGELLECDTTKTLIAEKNSQDMSIVKLNRKQDVIRCKSKEPRTEQDAFFAPLLVTLKYGYTNTISTKYNIEEPGKY